MTSSLHLKFRQQVLSEGTRVRIVAYEKRPEFVGEDGELGTYSKNDDTYECWLTGDSFDGALAFCKPEDFALITAPPPEKPKEEEKAAETEVVFGIGDRVRGKETGKEGLVVDVDEDGDPKVKLDGEEEALQRFAKEYDIVSKAKVWFSVSDRVRGKESGKIGTVLEIDEDGDPEVKIDGESEAQQRFGREFEIVTKGAMEQGDRVKGIDSGRLGKVLEVDEDGDPRIQYDGEEEAMQRFAKEFVIFEKANKSFALVKRSRSGSGGKKDKKKKKKKKKKSSSSEESSAEESSDSWHDRRRGRRKKRSTTWGHSALERMEEDKRRAADFQKKFGYNCDAVVKKTENFMNFDSL